MSADWGMVPSITTFFGEADPSSSPTKPSSPRTRQPSPRPKSKSPMRKVDGEAPARRSSRLSGEQSIRRVNSGEHSVRRVNSSRSPVRSPGGSQQRSPTSSVRTSRSPQRCNSENVDRHSSSSRSPVRSTDGPSQRSPTSASRNSRSPPRHATSDIQNGSRPVRPMTRTPSNVEGGDGGGGGGGGRGLRPRVNSEGHVKEKPRRAFSPTPPSKSDRHSAPNALNKPRSSRLSTVRMSGSSFLGGGGSSLLGRRGMGRPAPVITEAQDSPNDGPRARSESPTPTPREMVNGTTIQRHLSNEEHSPAVKSLENESTTDKLRKMIGIRKVAISPRNNNAAGFSRSNKQDNQRKPRVMSDRPVKSTPNKEIRREINFGGEEDTDDNERDELAKKPGAEIMSNYEPTQSVIREGIEKWVVCTRPEINPKCLIAEDMLDERHSRRQVKCVVWKPDFKHQDAGTKFALKIAIRGKSDVHSWRLFSEKDVMRSLDSPWHTKLVNTFKTDNCLYMLMEYEPLSSIDQYIEGGVGIRPGGLHAVRFYTACALIAIEYMHKRGVVHRDIKPSNFLIDKQGYLKICDYGLSKFLKVGERTNTLLGTVPYLSPELVNEKYYDHSVDLWSLGVSCYEMAYGTTPFEPRGMLNDQEWTKGVKSNIRNGQFRLPAERVGLPARLFMKNLLNRELGTRLGGDLNYEAVKKHSFFSPLDWPGVQMRTAPPPPVGKPLPKSSRMD